MIRFFKDAHYNFLQIRYRAYAISAAVIALGIVLALAFQVARGSWLNYGVDFTGGTLVQVSFRQPVSVAELRRVVETRVRGSEITRFGAENEFLIRAPGSTEADVNVSEIVLQTLATRYGEGNFRLERSETVGPKVGSELRQKALLAMLLSFAATLIYLAFRFEWRFGVAAVIATAHDILITLGIIAGFRFEVSLATVAAVLTIIGYSLNDTIVVFDRVRENLKKLSRREALIDILNRSINETLPRTIMTGSTTIATLVALAVFGGPTLRGFALILIAGIAIGTLSSIFVASPALYEIEKRWGEKGKLGRGVTRPTAAL